MILFEVNNRGVASRETALRRTILYRLSNDIMIA